MTELKRMSAWTAALGVFAIGTLAALSACGGGGGGDSGRLSLLLTDAPLDGVDAVNVTVGSVMVHGGGGGWTTVTSTAQTYNLLDLQNGVTAELGLTELSTGTYHMIRLILTDASVVVGGVEADLTVPSGERTGLKIPYQFEVEADAETEITIDFDAGLSLTQTGNGGYILRPVVKVVGSDAAAEIDDGDEEMSGEHGAGGPPDGRGPPGGG